MSKSKEEISLDRKAHYQKPEVKARMRASAIAYWHSPKATAVRQTPEYKAKEKARKHSPRYKEMQSKREKERRSYPRYKVKIAGRSQSYRLKFKYGISLSEKNDMLKKQDMKCAICQTDDFPKIQPCVDHDHVTGKIRAILCGHCNLALGYVKENIATLERMIEYLRYFSIEPSNIIAAKESKENA